ncbi:MAG: CDP-alcohol phosphatidyltransferase family protein [Candidatus Diapherotrites archaeon]|nr:CDP-alcohol phosphatidyltransferase family protein [Candidatus Diapherotrites archaeon]MDZ4255971.1 CDP-alcohol phosphatidyltransferase family protein [archaeon]
MLGALLRGITKPFFRALAQPFIVLRINPFWITWLGIPFALAAAWGYANQNFSLALILLILATIWDGIDGAVARAQGKQSLWGNYFETMVDKLIEIILFLGLAFVYPIAAIAALGFGLWSSYAKPRVGLVIVTDNRDWPAVGEHADKFVLLFLGTLLTIFYPSFQGMDILEITLWVIAIISFIGTLQRMTYAKRLIASAEKEGNVLPYLKSGKER